MAELRAYEVSLRGEYPSTICAVSAGKAKYQRLLSFRDAGWDVNFSDLRCKSVGIPSSDEGFKRTAKYRGVEFAKIGMLVMVGEERGRIVGKNSSANFNVLFEDGRYEGHILNCHPNCDIAYFDSEGKCLADFRKPRAEVTYA